MCLFWFGFEFDYLTAVDRLGFCPAHPELLVFVVFRRPLVSVFVSLLAVGKWSNRLTVIQGARKTGRPVPARLYMDRLKPSIAR